VLDGLINDQRIPTGPHDPPSQRDRLRMSIGTGHARLPTTALDRMGSRSDRIRHLRGTDKDHLMWAATHIDGSVRSSVRPRREPGGQRRSGCGEYLSGGSGQVDRDNRSAQPELSGDAGDAGTDGPFFDDNSPAVPQLEVSGVG
jgi:hypothetical protein